MADFKYTINKEIKTSDFKPPTKELTVKSVQFMVPILVKFEHNGRDLSIVGQMDYVSKEIVCDFRDLPIGVGFDDLKSKILDYLKQATTLPEETFMADPETVEQASDATRKFEEIHQEQVGAEDE